MIACCEYQWHFFRVWGQCSGIPEHYLLLNNILDLEVHSVKLSKRNIQLSTSCILKASVDLQAYLISKIWFLALVLFIV